MGPIIFSISVDQAITSSFNWQPWFPQIICDFDITDNYSDISSFSAYVKSTSVELAWKRVEGAQLTTMVTQGSTLSTTQLETNSSSSLLLISSSDSSTGLIPSTREATRSSNGKGLLVEWRLSSPRLKSDWWVSSSFTSQGHLSSRTKALFIISTRRRIKHKTSCLEWTYAKLCILKTEFDEIFIQRVQADFYLDLAALQVHETGIFCRFLHGFDVKVCHHSGVWQASQSSGRYHSKCHNWTIEAVLQADIVQGCQQRS